jgi:hypothetical protein
MRHSCYLNWWHVPVTKIIAHHCSEPMNLRCVLYLGIFRACFTTVTHLFCKLSTTFGTEKSWVVSTFGSDDFVGLSRKKRSGWLSYIRELIVIDREPAVLIEDFYVFSVPSGECQDRNFALGFPCIPVHDQSPSHSGFHKR